MENLHQCYYNFPKYNKEWAGRRGGRCDDRPRRAIDKRPKYDPAGGAGIVYLALGNIALVRTP